MNPVFDDARWTTENAGVLALLVAVILAAYALKGFALWRAGRNNQRGWFVALLLVNTLGILELIYLMTAGKKRR
jgi:methionyl-tRNA synthetase